MCRARWCALSLSLLAAALLGGLLAPGVASSASAHGTGDRHGHAAAPDSLRSSLTRERFYFVMPDRFSNGDRANDRGGLSGPRDVTGFDPTRKGWYHGGDLKGMTSKLDYIKGLGTTAIWRTPSFKNKPVQGLGTPYPSAGYRTIARLARLRGEHRALADGAQQVRYSSPEAGIFAFSRTGADRRVEYARRHDRRRPTRWRWRPPARCGRRCP